ncbi:MAG TPA: MFS transporter [Mycobacteriales bacterium]|jgi:EmrB/QacA subfamily drug resistance transporter
MHTTDIAQAGTAPTTHDQHPATHDQHPATAAEPDAGVRTSWAVLAVALTAQILVVLDISVVNTALPTIGASLSLSSSDLSWLVTAYLLLSGGGLLLGGRIADLLPRRGVFLTGMAVFTAGSLFSGLAGSATELIAGRAGQGLGAAMMTPAALSLVMTTYSGAQRTKGLALWGAVGSLGVAAGVLLGGALTTWGGWQLIFWVNVPIGIVALGLGLKVMPRNTPARASLAQFDLPGALTVIGGLAALMFGLASTSAYGWGSVRVLTAFVTSAALLTAFVRIERRAARPLVPPHTWKVTTLVSGTTAMVGVTALLVGTVFLTSIFVQTVLGFSALRAGVAFLPLAVAVAVGTHVAGKLLGRTSPRTVAAGGLVLVAVGAALLSMVGPGAHFASDLLPGLVVLGFGAGVVFVAVTVTAMAGIPAQHAGMASGFLMTGHEVGAALGVAILSAIAAGAGSLTDAAGVIDGFPPAFVAAAVLAVLVGVVAWLRMPAARMTGAAGMHMH